MAPLKVEAPCLACHAEQGYRVGDVRGGISISFDIQAIQGKLRANLLTVVVLSGVTIAMVLGLVTMLFGRLVRKLREARQQLHTLATLDELTGLWNRRSILARLEQEMERHRRQEGHLCCVLLDADHFKAINDTFGHLQGDDVLRMLAGAGLKALRTYDALGRYGGEEFLAVLPGTDLETALGVAERIRATVAADVSFKAPDGTRKGVTVSAGLTEWVPGEDSAAILHRVDEALYLAKAKGRNRVERVKGTPGQ
jgi:diguanylate cyclase (GGDEF)-like protein